MMLEIVDGYSRDFKVKFGGDKSKVMVINSDETDRDREWNIGEVKIGRTKEYKYLGCMLSENGCARAKGEKVVKAMQWWGRLSSVAKYRANKYECVRGIWKYVAVPSIMLGMNVMAWNGGDLEKLEVLQNRVGRLALGAPKWTAAEALRGDLGWSLFSERMLLHTFCSCCTHSAAAAHILQLLHTFCSCCTHSAAAAHILQLLLTFCSCYTHSAAAAHIRQLLHAFCSCCTHSAAAAHIQQLLHTFCSCFTHFTAASHILQLLHSFSSCCTHSAAAAHILQLLHTFCSCCTHSAAAAHIQQLLRTFCSCCSSFRVLSTRCPSEIS
ncbi:Armadillo-type fold [Trinorchestia longiramus]|nr:Armadillo-type fold [Trinorchestia longiramus]